MVWTVLGSIPGVVNFSEPIQTFPWAHPTSCKIDTRSLSLGYRGWGVAFITHPYLVPRFEKESFTSLLPLCAFMAFYRVSYKR